MLAKMKKVTLVGERRELSKVINALKADGNFQITFYKTTNRTPDSVITQTKAQLSGQINTVQSLLTYYQADQRCLTMTYQELQNITKQQKKIDQLLHQLEQNRATITELQQQIARNQTTIQTLQPFAALPIPVHLLQPTRNTFVLAGLISTANFARFQNDVGTQDYLYETYPAAHQKLAVVLTGEQENLALAETILSYDFTPFPANQTFPRTPQAEIERLGTQNHNLTQQIAALKTKHQPNPTQIDLLKTYYDYLVNELDTWEILTATIQTKSCFVVHGWIPARHVAAFTQLINHTSKNLALEITDATALDQPPALVHNTALVAPYNSITMMYGAPARTDLDPNPFVAIFFFLFFGMMFGDVAYGILLAVITGIILLIKRPRGGMQQLLALFCMGGLSAALWGLVFNSFFGMNLPSFILPQTLISPLGNDATLFFALSLYLGILQIMVGNLLNVINLLRNKQVLGALLKGLPHLVLFVGLGLSFPALIRQLIALDYAFLDWFQPLMWPGVIIMLVGFAGIVLFNGLGKKLGGYLVGAFSGAYKLVNYFSDILSYARLFGVGLVGCVIAYVANYLFGMFTGLGVVGYLIGGVIAVIFHALNIGLGLLSTYIHNARLQFVEFFGKFYNGSGTPFVPLGSQLRYIRLQKQTRI